MTCMNSAACVQPDEHLTVCMMERVHMIRAAQLIIKPLTLLTTVALLALFDDFL